VVNFVLIATASGDFNRYIKRKGFHGDLE